MSDDPWATSACGAAGDPCTDVDVYEIKLGDEFLMSSLWTVGETELARLGLAGARGADLDVLVGGLGLGFTADAVLDDPRVRSLVVVEALAEVIDWHHARLVPPGKRLTTDGRCDLVHGDFFSMASSPDGPDRGLPGAASTPSCSTSTTRRATCSTRRTRRSTGRSR